MKQKTNRLQQVLAAGIILVGLLILLYPWISNYLFDHRVDSTISVFENEVEATDQSEMEELFSQAEEYNRLLSQGQVTLTDPFVDTAVKETDLMYQHMLNLDESGLMGFVEIPKINVYLPIYHGTSNEVLERGIGHIEGSSLPIGGEGVHAVLSGHTGINSSKMFTDLYELEDGDLFFLQILNRHLAYRVDRIAVIEPEDTSNLLVEEGKDQVTLLTCTPYGVNTHRLIVTGQATEYTPEVQQEAEQQTVTGESVWMQAYKKAILIGAAIVAGIGLLMKVIDWMRRKHHRKRKRGEGR